MPEQLQPNETHVEQKGRVVGEPSRIPNTSLESLRMEPPDRVADDAPWINEVVDIADQCREVGEPEHKADPEEGETEIVQRELGAKDSSQYRQSEQENTQIAKYCARNTRDNSLDLDRSRDALGASSAHEEAEHQK